MEYKEKYVINEETVLLSGEYDALGKLCTRVVEGKKNFLVGMAPIELINQTLLIHGCSFQGALESSKYLLEPMKMYPIKINPDLGIWLFPTKSYKKHNCVWFSLVHVRKTKAIGVRKTAVTLSFGHTFTVEMKESSFNNRQQKAKELREIVTKNTKSPLTFNCEPRQGFLICEEPYKLRVEDASLKQKE